MASFIVREAVPDDAEQIVMHRRRIADEPDNMISHTVGEFNRTPDEQRERIEMMDRMDNAHMLVAEAEGQIMGFCQCRGGVLSATRHDVSLGIDVHRDWRGRGVGRALMTTMVAWARENPVVVRLELQVFVPNTRAIRLYESVGFQREGVRRMAFYKNGRYIDSIIMSILFPEK